VFLFTETLIAPSHNILLAHEHLRAVIITRIIALASIPLMFWLTPTYGALGAVVAAGLGRVASRFSATVYAWRVFSLRFPAAFLGRVAAATAIMAGAMLIPLEFLQRPSTVTETIVQTTLAFVTGSLVFGLAFKLLGGLEAADKQRLVTLKVPLPAFLLRWL
jgi:O-antigen/teichoic acid export membrane protein